MCPFGSTNLCNALDVGINKVYKQQMAERFRSYLSDEYLRQNRAGIPDSEIVYDFKLSSIKNKHLTWMIEAHSYISSRPQLIINSMAKALAQTKYDANKERERLRMQS